MMKKIMNVAAITLVCLASVVFIGASVGKQIGDSKKMQLKSEILSDLNNSHEELALEAKDDSKIFYSFEDYFAYVNKGEGVSSIQSDDSASIQSIVGHDLKNVELDRIKVNDDNSVVVDFNIVGIVPGFKYDADEDEYLRKLLTSIRFSKFYLNGTTITDLDEYEKNLAKAVGAELVADTEGTHEKYVGDVYAWSKDSNGRTVRTKVGEQAIEILYDADTKQNYVEYVYTPYYYVSGLDNKI